MYMYIYIYVSVSISISTSVFILISISISAFIYIYICKRRTKALTARLGRSHSLGSFCFPACRPVQAGSAQAPAAEAEGVEARGFCRSRLLGLKGPSTYMYVYIYNIYIYIYRYAYTYIYTYIMYLYSKYYSYVCVHTHTVVGVLSRHWKRRHCVSSSRLDSKVPFVHEIPRGGPQQTLGTMGF